MPDLLSKSAEDAIDNLSRRNAAGYAITKQTVTSELLKCLKWRNLDKSLFTEPEFQTAVEYIYKHI